MQGCLQCALTNLKYLFRRDYQGFVALWSLENTVLPRVQTNDSLCLSFVTMGRETTEHVGLGGAEHVHIYIYRYMYTYMGAGQNQRYITGLGPTLATYPVTQSM